MPGVHKTPVISKRSIRSAPAGPSVSSFYLLTAIHNGSDVMALE